MSFCDPYNVIYVLLAWGTLNSLKILKLLFLTIFNYGQSGAYDIFMEYADMIQTAIQTHI